MTTLEYKRKYYSYRTTTIVLAIALFVVGLLAVHFYDEYDYYSHMLYESENGCLWDFDESGNWTVCK